MHLFGITGALEYDIFQIVDNATTDSLLVLLDNLSCGSYAGFQEMKVYFIYLDHTA